MKKLWIWIAAFAAGILMLLFRMEISRYMFYITPDGQAIDAEYQDIAVQCQTTIKELLERANEY